MVSYRPEWEWGWKTPLLLDPASFSRTHSVPPGLLSPALLDSFPLSEADAALAEKLEALKSYRVGLRFERIQETLFRFHPRTLDLRAGIQIPGRTEIDLLQRIEPDFLVHWEIAAKFYLALDPEGSSDPYRFVGLSLQDCLGRKMNAVRERQLPVLEDAEVRASIGLSENDRVAAFPKVHGILFMPWIPGQAIRLDVANALNPPGVNPRGLRGYWIPAKHAQSFFDQSIALGFRIRVLLERKQWIQDQRLVLGIPQEAKPTAAPRPIQYALFSADQAQETRFFIVDDDWSDRAEIALESLRISRAK